MYSLEVIAESISRMEDDELIERWRKGVLSDDAKLLVEREFQKRGIDPDNPVPSIASVHEEIKPRKPVLIPALFAAIGGGTAGAKFGGAIAGAIGAGIGAAAVAAVGWYLGRLVVGIAQKWASLGVRVLVYCTALVVWFFLNAMVTALSLWAA